MTINWKQGLFAAAVLLTVSLLFVGCSKSKADKAVADKSTGEIIGEEIDVIEVVPAQTPNAKPNAVKEQKADAPTAPAQPTSEAPAMTPPSVAPTENAPSTTPVQTPENTTPPDASPSATTSDVTVSTSCYETTSEMDCEESNDVTESETASCCAYCQPEAACSPACAPCTEACQPACDAAPTCAPDPVCAPAPVCSPAPACAPVCNPCPAPCRCRPLRRPCRSWLNCCRASRCIRECSPCRSACEPACVSACASACSPACQNVGGTNEDNAALWSNDHSVSQDSTHLQTDPNKTTSLPDPKINEGVQRAKPSTAVGSAPSAPEAPSIVLPEAK